MIGIANLEALGYGELEIAAYQAEVDSDNRPRQIALAYDYKGEGVVAKVFHTRESALEWATAATAHFMSGAEAPLAIPLRRGGALAVDLWLGVAAGIDMMAADAAPL